jgi:hypothetical protein
MNEQEFENKVRELKLVSHDKIEVYCGVCNTSFSMQVFKIRKKLRKYNNVLCSTHAMSACWQNEEYKKNIANKISQKTTGVKKSEDTKKRMSESKLAYFKTDAGKANKQKLSKLTAQGHGKNKYEKSKRQTWYHSKKIDKLVFCDSSYELRLCWLLDQDDSVLEFQTQIAFEHNEKNRCLDCLVTYKDHDKKKKAIEVKPKKRLEEFALQIQDSQEYAKSQNWDFEIITEDCFGMSYKAIRDWADAFIKSNGGFDWAEHRKKRNLEKATKHYRTKISPDKVELYCEFCKENHTALRLTYDRNIARNGRYICEREGGKISGSKPKLHLRKENPYAIEGKKECNNCKCVKGFEEFGLDKLKSDGYATQCKICRSEKSRSNYIKIKSNQEG